MSFVSLRRSFAARIFLLYALMLLVVAGVLGGFSIWSGARRLEADLLERGLTAAEILATGARTAVYSENPALVRDVLAGVVDKREVLAAAVFTLADRPLAAEGDDDAVRGVVAAPIGGAGVAAGEGAGSGGCRVRAASGTLDVLCPVKLRRSSPEAVEMFFGTARAAGREEVVGHVRILLDRGRVREELGGVIARGLLLSLLLLVFGTVVVLLLARRVTGPLTRLTEEVHLLGAEGSAREIEVRRADEIGRLAEAFNAMLRALAERGREKDQLEERLRTARKMEAVGSLSRGIAHDFNNILSTVATAVHVLERGSPGNELVREYAGRIRVSLGRARELIERLMTFSRAKLPELRPLDLAATVRGLAPMIREAAGESVAVSLDLPAGPVPVVADADGIRQVLLNLCYNARDAMPGGGALRIGVSAAGGDGEHAGRCARIAVGDSGTGMEPAVRERMFEPFFSTKEVGRGTGLGLAIVHGIVAEHHGVIAVESAPGKGTTFTILLPCDGAAAAGEGA